MTAGHTPPQPIRSLAPLARSSLARCYLAASLRSARSRFAPLTVRIEAFPSVTPRTARQRAPRRSSREAKNGSVGVDAEGFEGTVAVAAHQSEEVDDAAPDLVADGDVDDALVGLAVEDARAVGGGGDGG